MSDQADKKLCPHCQSEVNPKASRCPHCQGKIYVWDLKKKALLGAIFIIALGIGFVNDNTPTVEVSPEQKIVQTKEKALHFFSKSYVEGILKSPSTAKFGHSPSTTQNETDENVFEVSSYVDSQNGFGAMVRSDWSVKARYIGGDDDNSIWIRENWKFEEVYFDGDKIK